MSAGPADLALANRQAGSCAPGSVSLPELFAPDLSSPRRRVIAHYERAGDFHAERAEQFTMTAQMVCLLRHTGAWNHELNAALRLRNVVRLPAHSSAARLASVHLVGANTCGTASQIFEVPDRVLLAECQGGHAPLDDSGQQGDRVSMPHVTGSFARCPRCDTIRGRTCSALPAAFSTRTAL
jgi:hypothetical protein